MKRATLFVLALGILALYGAGAWVLVTNGSSAKGWGGIGLIALASALSMAAFKDPKNAESAPPDPKV